MFLFSLFLNVLKKFREDFLCKVSELISQHIYEILYRKDLSRKYVFKNMNENYLKQESFNSSHFIKFCKLV